MCRMPGRAAPSCPAWSWRGLPEVGRSVGFALPAPWGGHSLLRSHPAHRLGVGKQVHQRAGAPRTRPLPPTPGTGTQGALRDYRIMNEQQPAWTRANGRWRKSSESQSHHVSSLHRPERPDGSLVLLGWRPQGLGRDGVGVRFGGILLSAYQSHPFWPRTAHLPATQ